MNKWDEMINMLSSPPDEMLIKEHNEYFKSLDKVPNNNTKRQTAWEHTYEVLNVLYNKGIRDTRILFGGLMHDIGKSVSTADILPHHYNHDKIGVEVLNYLKLNVYTTMPDEYYKLTRDAIFYHMRIHGIQEIKYPFKLYNLVRGMIAEQVDFDSVLTICEADHFSSAEYAQGKLLRECVNIINKPFELVEESRKKKEELTKLYQQIDLVKAMNM